MRMYVLMQCGNMFQQLHGMLCTELCKPGKDNACGHVQLANSMHMMVVDVKLDIDFKSFHEAENAP